MNAARPPATIAARVVVGLACSLAAAACSIGEVTHETVENPVHKVSAVKTCNGAFATPELSTLTPCGDGAGHCYDGSKTILAGLPSCTGSGDTCIPDKVLKANGTKPKSCTFYFNGKPGACVSLLLKDIAAHKGDLHQEDCDADERCAPCISPLDGSDTHLCDPAGVYQDKCQGGAAAQQQTCCHGQGLCINADAAPSDQRDNMSPDVCRDSKLCAPTALVDGTPQHCTAFAAPGVCIDLCFAKMLGPAAPVIRSGCGPTAVCLPCVIGSGQGVPGC